MRRQCAISVQIAGSDLVTSRSRRTEALQYAAVHRPPKWVPGFSGAESEAFVCSESGLKGALTLRGAARDAEQKGLRFQGLQLLGHTREPQFLPICQALLRAPVLAQLKGTHALAQGYGAG
jgi:hypothetical protein